MSNGWMDLASAILVLALVSGPIIGILTHLPPR